MSWGWWFQHWGLRFVCSTDWHPRHGWTALFRVWSRRPPTAWSSPCLRVRTWSSTRQWGRRVWRLHCRRSLSFIAYQQFSCWFRCSCSPATPSVSQYPTPKRRSSSSSSSLFLQPPRCAGSPCCSPSQWTQTKTRFRCSLIGFSTRRSRSSTSQVATHRQPSRLGSSWLRSRFLSSLFPKCPSVSQFLQRAPPLSCSTGF